MKFCRLIWFDIEIGLKKHPFYLSAIPLFFLAGLLFTIHIIGPYQINHTQVNANLGDIFLYCFSGKEPLYLIDNNQNFQIPILWISLFLGSSLSTLGYAENISQYDQQIFIRSEKRALWWLSKCVWNIISSLTYFSIGFATILTFIFVNGWKMSLTNTAELFPYIFPDSIQEFEISTVQFLFLIIAGSVSWNLLQMYLAMYVKSYISLLITIVVLLSSIYIYSPLLFGNYLMLARNKHLHQGIIDTYLGYFVFTLITIIAIVGGMYRTKKFDFIVKEE